MKVLHALLLASFAGVGDDAGDWERPELSSAHDLRLPYRGTDFFADVVDFSADFSVTTVTRLRGGSLYAARPRNVPPFAPGPHCCPAPFRGARRRPGCRTM